MDLNGQEITQTSVKQLAAVIRKRNSRQTSVKEQAATTQKRNRGSLTPDSRAFQAQNRNVREKKKRESLTADMKIEKAKERRTKQKLQQTGQTSGPSNKRSKLQHVNAKQPSIQRNVTPSERSLSDDQSRPKNDTEVSRLIPTKDQVGKELIAEILFLLQTGREGDDQKAIEALAECILQLEDIPKEIIQFMERSQNYTRHPKLGLGWFHLSSSHPDAFKLNNENFEGPDGTALLERFASVIGLPVGQDEAVHCQTSARKHDSSAGKSLACASCNETLYENANKIVLLQLDLLPLSFQLSQDELDAFQAIPKSISQKHISVFPHNGKFYHLNPNLVKTTESIVLCSICSKDPINHPFSLASGHDYGRFSNLPKLNDITMSAILPIRAYNIDILMYENKSTGHSICFPLDGAAEIAKSLPDLSVARRPRLTFLGPQEGWRKAKQQFRKLYSLDVPAAFQWLDMWIGLNHPSFQGITINKSTQMIDQMENHPCCLENDATVCNDAELVTLTEYLDNDDDSNLPSNDDSTPVDFIHLAVMPQLPLLNKGVNTALDAMVDIMLPDEDHNTPTSHRLPNNANNNIVAVSRGKDPINEWKDNAALIAGTFPHLFMLGRGIPTNGRLSRPFLCHLFNYYDGRFDDQLFIALAFNQLQRHACIRRTAQITTKHATKLENLGKLANSAHFRKTLLWARDNPNTLEAKVLNAKVCHILSLVGSSVPYSAFERRAFRPKMAAMRYRYDISSFFVTASPTEFDSLKVVRVAVMRATQHDWNRETDVLATTDFKWQNLPNNIASNPGARLQLTRKYPGLAAMSYIEKMETFLRDVVRCPRAMDTRVTRSYLQRERGAFMQVSAFNGVSEPQKGGRLHCHFTIYSSVMTPTLLTQLACAPPRLQSIIGQALDSTTCTHLSTNVRAWYTEITAPPASCPETLKQIHIRAVDILVPDARIDYAAFMYVAQQKAALTGMHKHTFCCEVPPKGRYMCRLCMGRGIHSDKTCPIMICLDQPPDRNNNQRAIVRGIPLNNKTKQLLVLPYLPLEGNFLKPHPDGPVVWELHRPASDTMFVEANLITTNILDCHSNASVINGRDAGEAVEEYQMSYMTKEGSPLKQAAALMLAALDDIALHPSVASDTGKALRTGKHLAQRTINSCIGSSQWSLPIMAAALLGHDCHQTSKTFCYIFPQANVAYVDEYLERQSQIVQSNTVQEPHPDSKEFVQSCLNGLMECLEENKKHVSSSGGATIYKLKTGACVFLSQADSYENRGKHFADYSQLEFECIVELLPKKEIQHSPGRKSRPGFALCVRHPLHPEYEGFVRAKMNTPILAGKPPPTFPGNKPDDDNDSLLKWNKEMKQYAKYLLDLIVPWEMASQTIQFERNAEGLGLLLHQWDQRSASLVNRQRFRYLHNVMMKGYRNCRNELRTSLWRERQATWWKDVHHEQTSNTTGATATEMEDMEATGHLCPSELHDLSNAATTVNLKLLASCETLTNTCKTLLGASPDTNVLTKSRKAWINETKSVVFKQDAKDSTLQEMRAGIALLPSQQYITVSETIDNNSRHGTNLGIPIDHALSTDLESNEQVHFIGPCFLTDEQYEVVSTIVDDEAQQLLMMHGGGGVGKSYAIVKTVEELTIRGLGTACSCPTGVGASYLPYGQTFASQWKSFIKNMNAGKQIEAIFKNVGGKNLKLVVIDEVSMLPADHLVLLDRRLRAMYDFHSPFGGISVLLVGDFMQLPVTTGIDLYKVMYTNDNIEARAIFQMFRIIKMTTQLRAASCFEHQQTLEAFRALPSIYPKGMRWSKQDNLNFQPITDKVVCALTTELTREEVMSDKLWITDSTILTTNNLDRALLNYTMAVIFGQMNANVVLCWRQRFNGTIPLGLQEMLYNKQTNPELFGYFVVGAPAQILDNGNGNVFRGVANGTRCKTCALAWKNPDEQQATLQVIAANAKDHDVIDLPHAPDFIIVSIEHKAGAHWPAHLSLEHQIDHNNMIKIPIGLMSRGSKMDFGHGLQLPFHKHAVDLAFAITAWKAQGGTYHHVLALLNPSKRPFLNFHLLYVMFSRVTQASQFRCFPLNNKLDVASFKNLRPNILAIKWQMDIGKDGYWHQHDSKGKNLAKLKSTNAFKNVKALTVRSRKEHSPSRPTLVQYTKTTTDCGPEQNTQQITQQFTQQTTAYIHRDEAVHFMQPATNPDQISLFFSARGMASLQPSTWVKDEPMDLFAILETQKSDKIHYIHSNIYALYLNEMRKGVPNMNNIIPRYLRRLQQQTPADLLSKPLWIAIINKNNNHWQTLCIINPGTEHCIALILDSLISDPSTKPSNYNTLMQFASDYIQAVHNTALIPTWEPSLVPKQPNGYDCGPFSILNVKHLVAQVDELVTLRPHHPETIHDFCLWYSLQDGVCYRSFLLQNYQDLMNDYPLVSH